MVQACRVRVRGGMEGRGGRFLRVFFTSFRGCSDMEVLDLSSARNFRISWVSRARGLVWEGVWVRAG